MAHIVDGRRYRGVRYSRRLTVYRCRIQRRSRVTLTVVSPHPPRPRTVPRRHVLRSVNSTSRDFYRWFNFSRGVRGGTYRSKPVERYRNTCLTVVPWNFFYVRRRTPVLKNSKETRKRIGKKPTYPVIIAAALGPGETNGRRLKTRGIISETRQIACATFLIRPYLAREIVTLTESVRNIENYTVCQIWFFF